MAETVTIIVKAKDEASKILGGIKGAFGSLTSVASGVFTAGMIGAGAALAGLTAGITQSITAASDLGETWNKVNTIFDQDALADVTKFVKDTGSSLGQTEQQMLDAASTFGIFGKSAGLTGEDLGSFSTDLTTLASDLASFHNTSPEEAIVALGAALRGESEPIRRYGVLLDDATLRQKALELGIVSTTKDALTPQQRVLAAQAVIMEQTVDAQGDFIKTSDGLANSQRILSAAFGNMKTTIGAAFLPVVEKAALFLKDTVMPAFQGFAEKVAGVVSAFTTGGLEAGLNTLFGAEMTAKILAVTTAISTFFTGTLVPFVKEHAEEIKGALTGIAIAFGALMVIGAVGAMIALLTNPLTLIIGLIGLLGAAWAGNWGGIRDTLTEFWTTTGQPIFEQIKTWLAVNVPAAIQTVTDYWNNTLFPALQAIWTFLSVDMMPIWEALANLLSAVVANAITGITVLWNDVLLPAMQAIWKFIQEKLIPIIDRASDSFGGMKGAVQGIADFINAIADAVRSLDFSKLGKVLGIGGTRPPGRATGGPVMGGMPYLIGERGPELFVPQESGRIIPNNQVANYYNLTINDAGSRGNVVRDFGLLKALAGV